MTIEDDPSCSFSTTSFHRHLYRSSCRADPTRHCHLTFKDAWKEMNSIFFSHHSTHNQRHDRHRVIKKQSYSQLHSRLHLSRSRYSFRFRTSVSPFLQVPPSLGRRNTRSRYENRKDQAVWGQSFGARRSGLRAQSSELQAPSFKHLSSEARSEERKQKEETRTNRCRSDTS